MAWVDRPTKAQINAIWQWFQWKLPTAQAKDALKWLEENATRKQASDEMGRLRNLSLSQRLTPDECLKGEVWQEYFNAKIKEQK